MQLCRRLHELAVAHTFICVIYCHSICMFMLSMQCIEVIIKKILVIKISKLLWLRKYSLLKYHDYHDSEISESSLKTPPPLHHHPPWIRIVNTKDPINCRQFIYQILILPSDVLLLYLPMFCKVRFSNLDRFGGEKVQSIKIILVRSN